MKSIEVACGYAVGDCVALTGAVRDFALSYPEIRIDVSEPFGELWANNPRVQFCPARTFRPRVRPAFSLTRPYANHLVEEHRLALESMFKLPIVRGPDVGEVHGPFDFVPHPQPYWVIVAGGKYDTVTKWWPWWQELVDLLAPTHTMVHLGTSGDWHPPLRGVIDLVGKTTLRQYASALKHAEGLISPLTSATHLLRAVGSDAPMLTLAGGREPHSLSAYPNQIFFTHVGTGLPCCKSGPCWSNKCNYMMPVGNNGNDFADCMRFIRPELVKENVLAVVQ